MTSEPQTWFPRTRARRARQGRRGVCDAPSTHGLPEFCIFDRHHEGLHSWESSTTALMKFGAAKSGEAAASLRRAAIGLSIAAIGTILVALGMAVGVIARIVAG